MAVSENIKAVVFDLDGTLLDTLPDIAASSNAALRHTGLPERTVEEFRKLIGNGIRVQFQRACPPDTPQAVYDETLGFYLSYYPEHCTVHTKFFAGIEEMIAGLKGAGLTLGVLSNKTETTGLKVIGHFFAPDTFALVWGNNGKRPLKPDPTAGTMLCEALGLSPAEIMYVGDGDTDMEFGSKNGFYTVGALWGYRDEQTLRKFGADALAEKPEELLTLLHL